MKANGRAIGRLACEEGEIPPRPPNLGGWGDIAPADEDLEVIRLVREAKRAGFPDRTIADFAGVPETRFRALRKRLGIVPTYKMVDTCAAEFEAVTPYYYSCYDTEDECSSLW